MNEWPGGFEWGVATSAYQIEGAVAADGRTPSVWDTFSRRDGSTVDGATGDEACAFYRRWQGDLDLAAGLGVRVFRFSVSWPRVIPAADGRANTAGLDFYDRVVDGLLARDISPVVALFHWDMPQWLQDEGGWSRREIVDRFADYAAVVADRVGDRVGGWVTINEPFEHFVLGHVTGEHAPGLRLPMDESFAVAHNLLLAHGTAVQALRAASGKPVMTVNSYAPARPYSDAEADRGMTSLYDLLQNRLFTAPILLGRYPDEVLPLVTPFVANGDLDVIAEPVDRWGVNYYSINAVRATDGDVPMEVLAPHGYPRTASDWAVSPDGLRETLLRLRDTYGERLPPLVVSENGCAYDDTVEDDGRCADPERIAFLAKHLDAVRAALDAGVHVRGFHVWSLLDNFEWAEGYTKRFGLVHVDYTTQRRTLKDSYYWYQNLVRANR